MDEKDVIDKMNRLMDQSYLRQTLSFFGLYISLYENFIETVVARVESFLCLEIDSVHNGKIKYKHVDSYKEEVKNRIVDEKGNKDTTKATMLWFVDLGAINQDEYELFLDLKSRRNSLVHDMADHVWNGVTESDIQSLISLFDLSVKLDKWWINEIEVPIMGIHDLNAEEKDRVFSLNMMFFWQMIQALLGIENGSKDKGINVKEAL